MKKQFKCDTTAQYKAYLCIKRNFELLAITVSLYDQESLMITDYKKEYAIINYNNNKITITYQDGTKQTEKYKSHEPCL